jgi:hypothetical protein
MNKFYIRCGFDKKSQTAGFNIRSGFDKKSQTAGVTIT